VENKNITYLVCCNPQVVATFPYYLGSICVAFMHYRVICAEGNLLSSGGLLFLMLNLVIYS